MAGDGYAGKVDVLTILRGGAVSTNMCLTRAWWRPLLVTLVFATVLYALVGQSVARGVGPASSTLRLVGAVMLMVSCHQVTTRLISTRATQLAVHLATLLLAGWLMTAFDAAGFYGALVGIAGAVGAASILPTFFGALHGDVLPIVATAVPFLGLLMPAVWRLVRRAAVELEGHQRAACLWR